MSKLLKKCLFLSPPPLFRAPVSVRGSNAEQKNITIAKVMIMTNSWSEDRYNFSF